MKKAVPLLLILLLAFVLRVFALQSIPNSLHDDELDVGYIGKYLYIHGEDIKGNTLPLYIDKFGDFRPAGIFYITGISTLMVGANEIATRLPSVLFGILTVGILYFFVLELFNERKIALFSTLLLAISPWHIVLSRATSEGVIGLFFLLLALYYITLGFHKSEKKYIFISVIPMLLSYMMYHSYRLEIILFTIPFLFYNNKKVNLHIPITLLIGTFLLINVAVSLTGWGSGRFNQIAFYKNPSLSNTIESQLSAHPSGSKLDMTATRTLHNKAIVYFRELATQYTSYFSPDFLFIKGGLPDRYVVPQAGLFYLITIPLFFLGLLFLYHKENTFAKKYLLYLLITSPIIAALTYDESPNIHRSLFLVVPFIIIASFGFSYLETFLKNRKVSHGTLVIYCILALELGYFFHQYIVHSPSHKSVLRNDGSKELAEYLRHNKQKYDRIIVNNAYEMPLYYLFFTNNFEKLPEGAVGDHNHIREIENIEFTNETCPSKFIKPKDYENKKILIVDTSNCDIPVGFIEILKITRKDQTDAFQLIETTKDQKM